MAQLIFLKTMKKFAFVFPGQGSQSVGMLDGWGDHPVVIQTLAEASDALGENIGQLIQQGPVSTWVRNRRGACRA
jgi:[acyl-carrier-protein] S-malonyltransferase